MLMLAGLMGLMMVGASAFVGLSDTLSDQDEDALPEEEAEVSSQQFFDLLDGEIVAGTAAGDDLDGTDWDDQIGGYSGDDVVTGGAGADVMHGMDGADQMAGQGGDDTLHGGSGDDALSGGADADALYGHMGHDQLDGGAGNDVLHGGAGADSLNGGAGNDAVHGGLGQDQLRGDAGQDTLFGGSGDDWIEGFTKSLNHSDSPSVEVDRDYLNGGAGQDVLIGGAGDVLTLGPGADQAVLGGWIGSGDDAAQIMDFEQGEDRLILVTPDDAAEADITIEPGEQETRITLNGHVIATLPAAAMIQRQDILLMQESAAMSLLGR